MPTPRGKKTAAEKAAPKAAQRAVAGNPSGATAARNAAIEALRKDLGERAFDLLSKQVHDVDTYTFSYHIDMPTTNPDLTVWALINALKGSSTKGQESVDSTKVPRLLEVRTKKDSKKLTEIPYTINFNSTQNCDSMLRHLYGDERDATERCLKCTKNNGALKGCIVAEGTASCANCDWNRSGAACSFTTRGQKRKAAADDDDDSDSDDTDPFEDLDRKTCQKLAEIFRAATNRKKGKKGKKRSSSKSA